MFGRKDCAAGSMNARATPNSASTVKIDSALATPRSAK